MNFGDDPMGEILSDDDSFFEDPKAAARKSSLTKTPEKKSVTDIFNILDKPESAPARKGEDWLGLDAKETKSPVRTPKLNKKISFEDDDDILGNLGLSKRPQRQSDNQENKGRKLDLLESILGPSKNEETEKKPTFDDILKESKARSSVSTPKSLESGPASLKTEDSDRKSTFDDLLKRTPSTATIRSGFDEVPREGRRGRRSPVIMDPLGLFTEPKEEIKPREEVKEVSKPTVSKSAPNISEQGLPDWLGKPVMKESKSENVLNKEPEPVKSQEVLESVEVKEEPLTTILTQQKLAQSNLEYQNMGIALQQQESQILMALQLKKYEENLSDMQLKQQEVIMKQEQQFNLLLERQFAKQQIMENNMRLQQERINNHIQLLIAQPPVTKYGTSKESNDGDDENEKIVNNLKQRQHEEVFLLEESYKKQISLLEQSLDSVEQRLKNDMEKISEVFEGKTKIMRQEQEEEITKYKEKIKDLEDRHLEELKQIRENSSRMIEEIKFEYSTLMENVKETKRSETSLFQESSSYLQKLDSNMEILFSNSRNLQDLRNHIESDYNVLSKAREESLKAKEEEIKMMRATLEKCREAAERERSDLLTLVRTLETKIAEQNQNAREERFAFQQATNILNARAAALDRESEFNRASIERERQQLKTLRESILAEQEKVILQVTEEKLILSAEKARLETSAKLTQNFDSHRAKAEIEAAVQMAREAAEMTDREREGLQREKCEVEKLKRTLKDQERKLAMRQSEIEGLAREAELRKVEGERAIIDSKNIENRFNERMKDLQNQLSALANRERKLAEEKIALSRERLTLNTMIRQNKKCALCSSNVEKIDDLNFLEPASNKIDEELYRLRMEIADEEMSR